MEQKTEASQAVDPDMLDAVTSKIAEFYPQSLPRDMEKNQRLARAILRLVNRAALKAQPAPIEAQGESPFKFRPWSKEAEMVEGWTAAEKARNEAQGEDSARLSIPVSAYLWLMGAGGDAFAPPLRAGAFWWRDTFNQLAGVDMMEIIRQDHARASAETGGVKP
jgi:hypothetical protein